MKKVFIKNFYLSFSIFTCFIIGEALSLYGWYLADFFKEFMPFVIGYGIFMLLLYILILIPKVQIDQDGITFFFKNHIFKQILRDQIGTIEIRGTTLYAILDKHGYVMCFLDRRKKIRKCLEMYNIDITKH